MSEFLEFIWRLIGTLFNLLGFVMFLLLVALVELVLLQMFLGETGGGGVLEIADNKKGPTFR